ncbi:MAG: hypothetical protein IMW89_22310 [Ktedonobacteraceae bacterium]|nr:hypothetical protein [Ktedonobacteraceae bacterium]
MRDDRREIPTITAEETGSLPAWMLWQRTLIDALNTTAYEFVKTFHQAHVLSVYGTTSTDWSIENKWLRVCLLPASFSFWVV